jgi:RecA-family ATPase
MEMSHIALAALTAQPYWVVWRYEPDEKGKLTKVPYQPHNHGLKASSTKRATWTDHASAVVASKHFDGIGFVLFETEIVAFDIDNCRNKETGIIDPWALQLISEAQSYTEITPSGTGLRIIGTGTGTKVHRKQQVGNGVSLESFRKAERFITVSGNRLPDTPDTLRNLDDLIDSTVAKLDGKQQSELNGKATTPTATPDFDSLPAGLKKQIAAEPFEGEDTSETAASVITQLQSRNWSDADIAALVKAHPIGQRYTGSKKVEDDIKRLRTKFQPDDQPVILRSYFAEELEQQPVEPVDWVVEHFIPSRAVTGLFGDGGTGKDLLALMLSTAAICEQPWLGKQVKQGRAMYFPVEDDDKELRRRQAAISDHYGIRYADFSRRLKITPLAGKDTVLAVFDQKSGIVKPTPLYFEIRRMVEEFKPALVIVGNRVNIFAVNQNEDTQARQCVQLLSAIAIECNTAVVMPGHVSVAGLSHNTGTSGTVQWSNACRSRLFLSRVIDKEAELDTDVRLLEVRKANWGPTKERISIRWTQGVFVQDTGVTWLPAEVHNAVEAEKEFLRMLDLTVGKVGLRQTSNNYAPKVFSDDPRCRLKKQKGKQQLAAAMDRLVTKGVIATEPYGPPSNPHERLVRIMPPEPPEQEAK